jgi:hypothetical protein
VSCTIAGLDCDGDGFANEADNCPTIANRDQDDEDSDSLGDACDPCPPSANNADDDGDGVGADCDPNPGTAGDAIALWEGFQHGMPVAHTSLGAPVVNPSSAWSYSGGAAYATASASPTGYTMLWAEPIGFSPHVTVSTEVTLDAFAGGTYPANAGPLVEQSANHYNGCVLGDYNTVNDPKLVQIVLTNTFAEQGFGNAVVPGSMATMGRLTETVDATGCHCTNGTSPVTNLGCTHDELHLGLASRQESAHFSWLMVVTSP